MEHWRLLLSVYVDPFSDIDNKTEWLFSLCRFALINAGVLYIYFTNFQKIDEEEYGGPWELTKEGFMTSFALFLVSMEHYYKRCEWIQLSHVGKDCQGLRFMLSRKILNPYQGCSPAGAQYPGAPKKMLGASKFFVTALNTSHVGLLTSQLLALRAP